MGARVARMFRNYNLENRAFKEISKDKPKAAPRFASPAPPPAAAAESVRQKDEPLDQRLRSVYVESRDPGSAAELEVREEVHQPAVASAKVPQEDPEELRPVLFSIPGHPLIPGEDTQVPKGKLTLAEAVKTLGNVQQQPQTWTAERVAKEYSLDLSETRALLTFFIPFRVKIQRPKGQSQPQIPAS